MSSADGFKFLTLDELHALVFRLDLAETIEPLDGVAARLRDEMVAEIERRDECPWSGSQIRSLRPNRFFDLDVFYWNAFTVPIHIRRHTAHAR